MRKLFLIMLMALSVCFAQEGTLKPEFQAFAGALVKLKPAEKGFMKFSLKVEAAPWAFHAIGEVRAPNGDVDLLRTGLFDGDVYVVLAYVPQTTAGKDGLEYNVGLFDIMLYYEDEPTVVRNLKFKLLPPADDDWAQGIFKDARESGSLLGNIWGGKYDGEITRASAKPIDKNSLNALRKKSEQAAAERETVTDTRKKNMRNMAKNNKKAQNSASSSGKSSKKGKKKSRIADDDCDAPNLSVKEKRRCQMRKGK